MSKHQLVKIYQIINISMELRFFTIVFFLLILSGCPVYDPARGALTVVNSTDSTWYVYNTCCDVISKDQEIIYSVGGNIETYDQYGFSNFPEYRIDPGDTAILPGYGTPIKPRIHCKRGKLNLFFISDPDMRERTWEEISGEQIYSHKRSFDQKELDSLEWVFNFRQ